MLKQSSSKDLFTKDTCVLSDATLLDTVKHRPHVWPKVVLLPGTDVAEAWIAPPIRPLLKIYYFNATNAEVCRIHNTQVFSCVVCRRRVECPMVVLPIPRQLNQLFAV